MARFGGELSRTHVADRRFGGSEPTSSRKHGRDFIEGRLGRRERQISRVGVLVDLLALVR
jgi:hypothetical protein